MQFSFFFPFSFLRFLSNRGLKGFFSFNIVLEFDFLLYLIKNDIG